MTPQKFLESKGIDVNEVIRVNGNVITVCELLKSFGKIKAQEMADYAINLNNIEYLKAQFQSGKK